MTLNTLRIADEFKLEPEVRMPPAFEAASRPIALLDFEYERSIIEQQDKSTFEGIVQGQQEPFFQDPQVSQYTSMGYSKAAVALALAYVPSKEDQHQVIDFCLNYQKLTDDMNFKPSLAAGALVVHKNDVEAATNTCVELSGAA